jgi:hypothetical protein
MISGLRLAFPGEELFRLLSDRADHHRRRAAVWQAHLDGPPLKGEEDVQLPAHMCELEVDRHAWRARVLDFLRGHVEVKDTYHLALQDLELAELLPARPGSVEQSEFEQRTALAFQVERLTRAVSNCAGQYVSHGIRSDTREEPEAATHAPSTHQRHSPPGDDGGIMLNAMVPHLERRRFTADEYQRMGEVGILSADERLELIDGEIATMTPIGPPHAAAVDRASVSFVTTVNRRAIVRVRGSVRLDFLTEPEPDVVLLRPRADFYASAHPGPQDILLIVEIADSSLRYDRDV